MSEVREYKCPCCDGGIEFDAKLQKLKCPYCGTEFDVETLSQYDGELQSDRSDDMVWETAPGLEWQEEEVKGLKAYICNSCGGEIVGDETMAATSCPYCGDPVVVMKQFSGDLKPDYVIPFKTTKNDAIAALKKHYHGKKLMPKIFKDQNHIEEIKGIYVPFWLFDTDADAHMRYKATRTRFWSDSNYNYTETSYYSVIRGGEIRFEKVPVDGSSKLDDTLMESLEPFNFGEAVDFKTAYLAGYLADKYDVDAEQSVERANARIKKSTEDAFYKTVTGYSTVVTEASGVKFNNGKANYALYPVWILTTKWKDKVYTFAMNGQTGRFAGDLPMDKGAFKRWFFGIMGAVSVAALGLSYIIWLL